MRGFVLVCVGVCLEKRSLLIYIWIPLDPFPALRQAQRPLFLLYAKLGFSGTNAVTSDFLVAKINESKLMHVDR